MPFRFQPKRIPRNVPREMRQHLLHLNRALQQDAAAGASGSLGGVQALNPNLQNSKVGAGSASVQTLRYSGHTALPQGQPGEILVLVFSDAGTLIKGEARLDLVDDYHHDRGGILVVQSDGQRWQEVARPGGALTVVNMGNWISDGAPDVTEEVQTVIDLLIKRGGGTLYFPRGTYTFQTTVNIYGSNIRILCDPGAVLKKEGTDNLQLFNVAAAKDGTDTATITATVNASDLTVSVASGAEAAFAANDWVLIEDDEATYDGTAQVHSEINRVRSTADGVITLYWPSIDTYSTATRTITKIMGREDDVAGAVENVVFQGGTFKNSDGTNGGTCIRFQYAHNCQVEGVTFEAVRTDCVGVIQSSAIRVSNCHFMNAPYFDGSVGYGVTTTGAVGVLVDHCTFERFRHAVDFSYWSQHCTAQNNHIRATGLTSLTTHPNTRFVAFCNNVIDGACGNDGVSGDGSELVNTSGAGNDLASAIFIDAAAEYAEVSGNRISNVTASGIWVVPDSSGYISIRANILNNINHANLTTQPFGAIRCVQHSGASPDIDRAGIQIKDNIINGGKQWGIVGGVNGLLIDGNYVGNITDGPGIHLRAYNAGGGGSVQSVERMLCRGNFVEGVSGTSDAYGISVGHSDGAVTDIIIEQNFVYNTQYSGIHCEHVTNTDRLHVTGNYVVDVNTGNSASYGGIMLAEWPSGQGVDHEVVTCTDNYISGLCRVGLFIGLSYIHVANNTCMEITSATGIGTGLFCTSRHSSGDTLRGMLIMNNYVYGAATWGAVLGTGSGDGLLYGNLFAGNRIVKSSREGLLLRVDCDKSIVYGNYFDGNGQGGAYSGLDVDGDDTIVAYNIFVDTQSSPTQDYGVDITANANNTVMKGNIFRDNQLGPFLDGGTNTSWDDTHIPASWWGMSPGLADNTAAFQAALDGCPAGHVLYVAPGTYNFTDTGGVTMSRDLYVSARGVVLDWVDTVLVAPAFTISTRPTFQRGYGLFGARITRTAGTPPNQAQYTGLQLSAPLGMHVEDVVVSFYEYGIELVGGTSQGCIHNTITRCYTISCHKHLYLHSGTNGGWCNENRIEHHRCQQSITDATERNSIYMVHIEYESAASFIPNNNVFENCNLECVNSTQFGVVVEGSDNYFKYCRWEGIDSCTFPILIGNVNYSNSSFQGNQFLHGNDIGDVIKDPTNVTFIDNSGGPTYNNNRNSFIGDENQLLSGGDGADGYVRVQHAGSSTSPSFAICRAGGGLEPTAVMEHKASGTGGFGAIDFNDTAESFLTEFYQESGAGLAVRSTASPQFRVRYDASNALEFYADASGNGFIDVTGSNMYLMSERNTGRGIRIVYSSPAWVILGQSGPAGTSSRRLDLRSQAGFQFHVPNGTNRMTIDSTKVLTLVPLEMLLTDAGTNNVVESLFVKRGSTGTVTAGFGTGLSFSMHNGSGTFVTGAFWESFWEDVTAGVETCATRLRMLKDGSYDETTNLFLLCGTNASIGIDFDDYDVTDSTTYPTSKLHVKGSIAHAWFSGDNTDSPYTLDIEDGSVVFDTSTANVIVNLPAANTCEGRIYFIKNRDIASSGTVTVTPNGTDTIDEVAGTTNGVINQGGSLTLQSNGVDGWIIA